MDIGVFGATGVIGSALVAEADGRGHRVTAFTRDPVRFPSDPGDVTWRAADILALGPEGVAAAIDRLDVVVSAITSGGDIADQIAHASVLPAAARVLLKALERRPSARLVVIGGGGSLESEPGKRLVDDVEAFEELLTDVLEVPAAYREVVLAHAEALDLCRLSDRNWTYVSPSAGRILSGERTGRYLIGGDQVLPPAQDGRDLSAEDLAAAVIDEAELPRHVQRRFTVAAY